MRILTLTESKLKNLVCESVIRILNENMSLLTEDKRTKQAHARSLNVIRNHFGNASWLDTVFEHEDNPDRMTNIDYMFYHFEEEFYHDPRLRNGATMRLEPLFCRLAFEAGFQQSNPDVPKLQRLMAILNLMYDLSSAGKIDLQTINIDTTTFEDLNNEFGKIIDQKAKEAADERNNTEYQENNDYKVIGPVDFETANKYGSMSCPGGEICYTQNRDTWNGAYTRNDSNSVYIILKNGWENIPAKHDDRTESAYDTYGLSMIFVIVDDEGKLIYCNTRWNHHAKYIGEGHSVDQALTENEISNLIGRRFEDVFKGKGTFKQRLQDAMHRLANGEDPRNVFDGVAEFDDYGIAAVKLKDKWNYINTNGELLSKWWLDYAFRFDSNGLAKVKLCGKWNLINTNGEFFSKKWLTDIYNSQSGLIIVRLNDKWNVINNNGELISDQWFDKVGNFENSGFAFVRINNKYNLINQNGNIVCDQWFDYVDDFQNGFAAVELNGKWNFINTNGDLVLDQWYDAVYPFDFNGLAKVKLNNKCNLINQNGDIVCDQWFDGVTFFQNGFAAVELNGKWNYINTNGDIISNQWFDYVFAFRDDGTSLVKLNNEYFNINTDGDILIR